MRTKLLPTILLVATMSGSSVADKLHKLDQKRSDDLRNAQRKVNEIVREWNADCESRGLVFAALPNVLAEWGCVPKLPAKAQATKEDKEENK